MTRLLFIIFFSLTISALGQTSDTSFVTFWSTFHKDLIAKNYKSLSSKTQFPLKAKGQLDYDTVDKYAIRDFEKVFSSFLSAQVHTNGSTRHDKFKTYKLEAGDKTNTSVRIDNMVFEKIKGKWWLTLIYDGHSKY